LPAAADAALRIVRLDNGTRCTLEHVWALRWVPHLVQSCEAARLDTPAEGTSAAWTASRPRCVATWLQHACDRVCEASARKLKRACWGKVVATFLLAPLRGVAIFHVIK